MHLPADAIQLIETLRITPGRQLPLLPWHLDRLRRSCDALGFAFPASVAQILQDRIATLDTQQSHRLRLLVGPGGELSLETQPLPATVTPVILQLENTPLVADIHWLAHKTTHRPWYAAATQWLQQHPEVFDIVFCNRQGEVCEGSRTNVYIQDSSGDWLTPPVSSGLLPGTQRQALLDQGLVREAVISKAALIQAENIRISNGLRGWLDARLATD